MTRFTFKLLAVVVAAAVSMSAANAAPIIIDNFNNPAAPSSAGLPGGLTAGGPSGDLSGTRSVTFSPSLPNVSGNSASIGGGVLRVDTGSVNGSNAVQSTLLYSFSGGPLDFSGLSSLSLGFDFTDAGSGFTTLPFSVAFLTGSGDVTATGTITDGTLNINLLPGNFSGPGSLSTVNGLRIIFNSTLQPGADFALTSIRADGEGGVFDQGDPTPEPASMFLFGGLVLGGLAVARRKLASRRAATV